MRGEDKRKRDEHRREARRIGERIGIGIGIERAKVCLRLNDVDNEEPERESGTEQLVRSKSNHQLTD